MNTRSTILAVLAASACACAERAAPAPERWRELEARIVAEFPAVTHVSTGELAAELARRPELVLVDVRRPDEFAVSHLPGARNVPSELDDDELAAAIPRDRPVVVYCSVGWRSAQVADRLRDKGYDGVRNHLGSIFDWANRGLPLERDGGRAELVHPYSASWGELLRPALRAAR